MPGAYRRGMVFGAFLGGCLSVGLLGASLGTDYWIVSKAMRAPHGVPHHDSDGKIHFGLFHGVKELNVGYGWRTDNFSMREVLAANSGIMDYWGWLSVCCSLCCALVFSVCAALFSLIHSAATPATAPVTCFPLIDSFTSSSGLFLWNSLAIVFETYAVVLWTWQYYEKLRYNVMTDEDLKLSWTTVGLAFLGHSYWLVITSLIVHIINIIFIYSGTNEMRQKKAAKPVLEEKPNGNIMLY